MVNFVSEGNRKYSRENHRLTGSHRLYSTLLNSVHYVMEGKYKLVDL